jgi:hypothetical protein
MDYAALQLMIAGISATIFAILGGVLLATAVSSRRDPRDADHDADAGQGRGGATLDAMTARELSLLPLGWSAIVAWSALHAVLSPQEGRDRGIAERSLLFLSLEFLAVFVLVALAQCVVLGDRSEAEPTAPVEPSPAARPGDGAGPAVASSPPAGDR